VSEVANLILQGFQAIHLLRDDLEVGKQARQKEIQPSGAPAVGGVEVRVRPGKALL